MDFSGVPGLSFSSTLPDSPRPLTPSRISSRSGNFRISARRWRASRRISAGVPGLRNPNLEADLSQSIAGPAFRRRGLEVSPPPLSTPNIIVSVGLVTVVVRLGGIEASDEGLVE